ncbi:MAG: hypothetical protein WC869_11815 [Phycisphaerae bacterium]|jgi:hypothetical protein
MTPAEAITAITKMHRAVDQMEGMQDLASIEEALRDLTLRLAGLRTLIMDRRHSYGVAAE